MGDVTYLSIAHALASIKEPLGRAELFLAAAAYPEPGKGFEGGEGERFMQALHEWEGWRHREQQGLPALRRHLGENSFKLKPLKDWKATLRKGAQRLVAGESCLFAYELATGLGEPVGAIFRLNPVMWSKRLNLSKQPVGEHRNEDERIRDLRRTYRKFEPVLPLLYAARRAAVQVHEAWPEPRPRPIGFWNPCYIAPMMSGMLANCDRWIGRSIAEAEAWRLAQPDADLMLKVAPD